MPLKLLFAAVLSLLLAGLAWQWRDSPLLAGWKPAASAGRPSAITAGTQPPVVGVHKCVLNGVVTYSGAPCLAAQSEQAVKGGVVTVVRGEKPAAPTQPGLAGVPSARDMLGRPDDGPSVRAQQVERVVNQ